MGEIRVGNRVEFAESFDFQPHAMIEKGERGAVVSVEPAFGEPAAQVRLDHHHLGLAAWDNTVLVVGTALEVLRDLMG